MQITIEISKPIEEWRSQRLINKNIIKQVVKNILHRFVNLKKISKIELSILLTNDINILYLNHRFRGERKSTNVLSFPDKELDWKHLLEFQPDLNYMYLGDVAFSYDTILREAISENKTFTQHFIHLLVHSILHLLGFDHNDEEEETTMRQFEVSVLQDFAIPSPYSIKS